MSHAPLSIIPATDGSLKDLALIVEEQMLAPIATVHDYGDAELTRMSAEFIVTACNGYDAMVEALHAIEEGFRDGSIKWAKSRQSDSDPYHKANTLMCAALDKAEGRTT